MAVDRKKIAARLDELEKDHLQNCNPDYRNMTQPKELVDLCRALLSQPVKVVEVVKVVEKKAVSEKLKKRSKD